MNTEQIKSKIINAGYKAVDELIKVAEQPIVNRDSEDGEDLAADRLKNAAATKKLAILDAFEILNRIELEKESIEASKRGGSINDTRQGFAERKSGKK